MEITILPQHQEKIWHVFLFPETVTPQTLIWWKELNWESAESLKISREYSPQDASIILALQTPFDHHFTFATQSGL